MVAYCGLDCSRCIGFIATQSGKEEELDKVAKIWSVQFNAYIRSKDVVCYGCKGPGPKSHRCATHCKVRVCCIDKGFQTCVECKEYPCDHVSCTSDHAPSVF